MILFEITDGYEGESVNRCYVWAANWERAIALVANPHGRQLRVRHLFGSEAEEFATQWSDTSDFPEI